jgi:hypothetical protein
MIETVHGWYCQEQTTDHARVVVISFSDNSSSSDYSDDETDTASETRETTDTADEI